MPTESLTTEQESSAASLALDDAGRFRVRRDRRSVIPRVGIAMALGVAAQQVPLLMAGDRLRLGVALGLLVAGLAAAVAAVWRPRAWSAWLGWSVFIVASLMALALGAPVALAIAWMVNGAALSVVLFLPLRFGWAAPVLVVLATVAMALAPPLAAPIDAGAWLMPLAALPVIGGAVFTVFFAHMNRKVEEDLREEARRRRDAEQEARAAGLAREDLIARIVHDLRTPMNGVAGLSELLLRGQLAPDQREKVRLISRQTDLFLTLVNDLLDFSQLAAKGLRIRERSFDLRQLVDETLSLARPGAEDKRLALEANLPPNLPPRLVGDSTRIRQILNNLLGNAVKFTAEGRVELVVELEREATSGPFWVDVVVRDTGPGVPESQWERIFQPFAKAHDSASRRPRGSGLGLAISSHLAELMGGKLTLDRSSASGSTFRLRLPLGLGEISQEIGPPPAAFPRPQGGAPSPGAWGRLLVVEDDPVNRVVIAAQLNLLGLAADEVVCGLDAVQAFAPGRYTAVLLDCDLPDIDGYEVARRLRRMEESSGTHTPILAVTASAFLDGAERWRTAGMDDLLPKPYRLDELAAILSAWLPEPVVPPAVPASGPAG